MGINVKSCGERIVMNYKYVEAEKYSINTTLCRYYDTICVQFLLSLLGI